MSTYYTNTEALVIEWLKVTEDVASLVTRPDGAVSIFRAMPKAAPLPSIVLSRVGGAPERGSDVPTDVARISFDCWAASRDYAIEVSLSLVSVLEDLAPTGGYLSGSSRLMVAETLSWVWLPDPVADTPRYVVDALITAVTE